jgi:hypothetical protein
MEKSPILFMSPSCPACQHQKQIISQWKSPKTVYTVNVDKFPNDFGFVKSLPTWIFPTGDGLHYRVHPEIIENPQMLANVSFGKKPKRKLVQPKRKCTRRSRFGETALLPNINDLAYYGKNFPNGGGFNTPDSFSQGIQNVWGTGTDALNAGIGGTRSLGPDNIGEMYSNNYVNNIRMAHPSDQLGSALYLNRTCNIQGNQNSMASAPGMIFDASNPQIVDNTTGFGKKSKRKLFQPTRKTRFGNLYSQMGPASEIGNQYLINKNTGQQLYSGGRQDELPRPNGIDNKYIYVGQAPVYNPKLSFGKKRKTVKKDVKKAVKKTKVKVSVTIKGRRKSKIGEGSTLVVSRKSRKIKVKN